VEQKASIGNLLVYVLDIDVDGRARQFKEMDSIHLLILSHTQIECDTSTFRRNA
jgi:hypothetical protein